MGVDPKRYAAEQIEAEGGAELAPRPFAPAADIRGRYLARGNEHEVGLRYEDILQRLMSSEFAAIESEYDRAVHLELPGGITTRGWAAADAFWVGLRSSFPNATFTVHHRIGRSDPEMAPRSAIRWSLDGVHDGWGAFGAPTGAPVHVMGISHAEFGPWGLRREYTLYDEAAIWKADPPAPGLSCKTTSDRPG